jgi:hypothetical protein
MSNKTSGISNRRAFLQKGVGVGLAGAGLGLLPTSHLLAQLPKDGSGDPISQGDAALLRFAAAAEILESDFWLQYNELGGIQDKVVRGGSGNPKYTQALSNLDDDIPQYVHDNTADELTHANFLNAYLMSKGAQPVDLAKYRTLPGSKATGSSGRLRLTNLMQLTIDSSWYTRYRDDNHNPDLDPKFVFPQAVPDLANGQFPAIPRTDDDLNPQDHLQAIANTAAFHMPTIEQGGNSLYPSMAQRASSVEVLRILISIGPAETMHFQTWADIAADVVSPPFAPLTDPTNGLTFPDLEDLDKLAVQPSRIMPQPCPFLSRKLPRCSIIRPTMTQGTAMNVVEFLTKMGLFIGQSDEFFHVLAGLAQDADAAQRRCHD